MVPSPVGVRSIQIKKTRLKTVYIRFPSPVGVRSIQTMTVFIFMFGV